MTRAATVIFSVSIIKISMLKNKSYAKWTNSSANNTYVTLSKVKVGIENVNLILYMHLGSNPCWKIVRPDSAVVTKSQSIAPPSQVLSILNHLIIKHTLALKQKNIKVATRSLPMTPNLALSQINFAARSMLRTNSSTRGSKPGALVTCRQIATTTSSLVKSLNHSALLNKQLHQHPVRRNAQVWKNQSNYGQVEKIKFWRILIYHCRLNYSKKIIVDRLKTQSTGVKPGQQHLIQTIASKLIKVLKNYNFLAVESCSRTRQWLLAT